MDIIFEGLISVTVVEIFVELCRKNVIDTANTVIILHILYLPDCL